MLDAHGTPKTNDQSISMGNIIIKNALIFTESVKNGTTNPMIKTHGPTSRTISQLLK